MKHLKSEKNKHKKQEQLDEFEVSSKLDGLKNFIRNKDEGNKSINTNAMNLKDINTNLDDKFKS